MNDQVATEGRVAKRRRFIKSFKSQMATLKVNVQRQKKVQVKHATANGIFMLITQIKSCFKCSVFQVHQKGLLGSSLMIDIKMFTSIQH